MATGMPPEENAHREPEPVNVHGVEDEVMEDTYDLPENPEQAIAMDAYINDWFEDVVPNREVEDSNGSSSDVDAPPPTRRRQKMWEEAETHARTPIYDGARMTKLSSILALLNLQSRHNASNILLDEVFHLLHDLLLPEDNVLLGSWSEAKSVLRSMGMEYHIIHACVNDCILFRGEHKDRVDCPEYAEHRYERNMLTEQVPRKSVRWFPIIPRLLHQFRCKDLAELMVWHSKNRSEEGVIRLPVDSPAFKHVEDTWPEFKTDPRHVRLGLAGDGISPHNLGRPTSIWPIVLTNYNIPPWLSTKKGHLMLSLIIPGPKKVDKIDTYLALIVEELQSLWKGVDAVDGRSDIEGLPRRFNLKGILMWTMHDYPGMYIYLL